MADIADAVEQDQIAESLIAEPEETAAAQADTATEEAEQPEQPEQAESEEVADDWLPTEQEKVFPQEVLAKYAPRYGFTAEELQGDPRIARIVHDKLNSDIYVQQLKQQQEQSQEIEQEAEPTRQEPNLPTREQYFKQISSLVEQKTDPEVAKQFHADFLRSFGVPEQEISQVPAQQALQFTHMASKYMLNMVNTFLPDLLGPQIKDFVEQAYPSMGDMYEKASFAHSWDGIRNSNPEYANLPAYGSKEFIAATKQAAAKIAGSVADFDAMVFTRNGKPVSQAENARIKYGMIARQLSSDKMDPVMAADLVKQGEKKALRAANKREAGNLGAGQSKGKIAVPADDDIFTEGLALYRQNHGSL